MKGGWILLLTLCFIGCKKYPEGPALSFKAKSERISNHWIPEKVFVNGSDQTASFQGLTMAFRDDANFTFTFYMNDLEIYSGTWTFSDHNNSITFTYITGTTTYTRSWEIIRLKEEEFFAEEVDSGNTNRYELIPYK